MGIKKNGSLRVQAEARHRWTQDRHLLPRVRQNDGSRRRSGKKKRGKSLLHEQKPYGRRRADESKSERSLEVSARAESSHDMLSHCANTECSKPFLRLRDGKLFLVETERLAKPGESTAPPFVRARQKQRLVEHYWLCDECASHWTLVYDREHGVGLAPLRRPIVSIAAANAAHSGAA